MTADNTKRILRLHTQLAKVMADGRFADGRRKGADLRAFIIAYYWASFEGGDRDDRWERTKELAGLSWERYRSTGWRLRQLYDADLPRFEPISERPWADALCCALMVRGPRAGDHCRKSSSLTFRRTDPTTGEWATVGYCTRHREIGEREFRNERQRTYPVPMPNTGGLLPCYIRATNWSDIYHDASHGTWKPPLVGITADHGR